MIRPEIRPRMQIARDGIPEQVFDIFVDVGIPGHPDVQILKTVDTQSRAEGIIDGWKLCRDTYQKLWG